MNQTLANIQKYLSSILKVFYEGPNVTTISNNFWKGGSTCLTYTVNTTKYNSPTGVKASDLHVFIHSDLDTLEFVGLACSWLGQGSAHPDRPNYGIFTLPFEITSDMKTNNFSLSIKRTVYNTILHQLFHILGLSKSEYSYWHKNDASYYTN